MDSYQERFVQKRIKLKDGERGVLVVRRYWASFAKSIAISLLLIALPFFLLYPLFNRWDSFGVAVFAILLAGAAFYASRTLLAWYYNVFVLTTRRVVDMDQKGMLDRTVSEAFLDRVLDVSYRRKGLFQTMLNYGTVQIQTLGTHARLELRNVKSPEAVQEVINQTVRRHGKGTDSEARVATEAPVATKRKKRRMRKKRLDNEIIGEIFER